MQKGTVKKRHRKYDADFKKEALRQVQSGRSVPEVARSLGIGENLLYGWRAQQRAQMGSEELSAHGELEQLRKQLRAVETERDILKKALLIFGRVT